MCTFLCSCMAVHVFPASGCSLQLSVFIYSCSQCVPGTAAPRPASPEAKECPLFLLLLFPASPHTPRPRPQWGSGHLRTAQAKQTCRASGSTEPIYIHLDRDKVRKLGKNI